MISWDGNNMRRKKVRSGENISFIAKYLFDNPGARQGEIRQALCQQNGVEWTTPTEMRGQYTTYFCSGWIGGSSWPRNPCGRYWTRMIRPDGKTGYMLTIEGISKVNLEETQ